MCRPGPGKAPGSKSSRPLCLPPPHLFFSASPVAPVVRCPDPPVVTPRSQPHSLAPAWYPAEPSLPCRLRRCAMPSKHSHLAASFTLLPLPCTLLSPPCPASCAGVLCRVLLGLPCVRAGRGSARRRPHCCHHQQLQHCDGHPRQCGDRLHRGLVRVISPGLCSAIVVVRVIGSALSVAAARTAHPYHGPRASSCGVARRSKAALKRAAICCLLFACSANPLQLLLRGEPVWSLLEEGRTPVAAAWGTAAACFHPHVHFRFLILNTTCCRSWPLKVTRPKPQPSSGHSALKFVALSSSWPTQGQDPPQCSPGVCLPPAFPQLFGYTVACPAGGLLHRRSLERGHHQRRRDFSSDTDTYAWYACVHGVGTHVCNTV